MKQEIEQILSGLGLKIVDIDNVTPNAARVREIGLRVEYLTLSRKRIFHDYEIVFRAYDDERAAAKAREIALALSDQFLTIESVEARFDNSLVRIIVTLEEEV